MHVSPLTTTVYTQNPFPRPYRSVAIPMALTASLWRPRATRHLFLNSATLGFLSTPWGAAKNR